MLNESPIKPLFKVRYEIILEDESGIVFYNNTIETRICDVIRNLRPGYGPTVVKFSREIIPVK